MDRWVLGQDEVGAETRRKKGRRKHSHFLHLFNRTWEERKKKRVDRNREHILPHSEAPSACVELLQVKRAHEMFVAALQNTMNCFRPQRMSMRRLTKQQLSCKASGLWAQLLLTQPAFTTLLKAITLFLWKIKPLDVVCSSSFFWFTPSYSHNNKTLILWIFHLENIRYNKLCINAYLLIFLFSSSLEFSFHVCQFSFCSWK